MAKETVLQLVKDTAMAFLMMDVELTPYSPLVILHPIFESAFVGVTKGGSLTVVDVTAGDEQLNIARAVWRKNIQDAESVDAVCCLIRKSYRLTFLKHIKPFLKKRDFSRLLGEIWISSENPNQDINVPIKMAAEWFERADKTSLMEREELITYQEIPDTLTVYRGVAVGRNPEGLSWTVDKGTANWFAHRYDIDEQQGYTLAAHIDKEDVLAYFSRRGEHEVVVNTLALQRKNNLPIKIDQ